MSNLRVTVGQAWDGRWYLNGPNSDGAEVAALGEIGLELCSERKKTGFPSVSLRASPAVWKGNQLLAAPLAGMSNGWTADLLRAQDHFFAALLSH